MTQTNATTTPALYFEDYVPGTTRVIGSIEVTQDEVQTFARRYDPQPFHTDPQAAQQSHFGGLIASGWMTGGLMMRMLAQQYYSPVSSLGSPGLDEIRWTQPVRPGDTLSVRITVVEARRSQSKPDRGLVRSFFEVLNQRGEVVMTVKAMNLIACRPAGPSAPR